MNKKPLILIGVGFLVIVLILISLGRFGRDSDGFTPEVTIRTDPDTGEQIRTTSNEPEQAGDNQFVTILGAASIDKYMSRTQFNIFRDSLYIYLNSRHGDSPLQVKILPDTVVYDGSNEKQEKITATMLIEKTDKRIGINIELIRANGVDITYTDNLNQQDPVYRTGPIVSDEDQLFYSGGDGLDGEPHQDH